MTVFVPSLGASVRAGAGCSSVCFLAFPSGESRHLEVWTNLDGQWREHVFQQCNGSTEMLSVIVPVAEANEEYEFTFRSLTSEGEVQWLSQAAGTDNGRIIKSESIQAVSDESAYYPLIEYDSRASIESDSGKSVKVIRFGLPAGEVGSIASFNLGRPQDPETKGLIVERTKPWWFTHRNLQNTSELSADLDVQLLILGSGEHVQVFFPLSTSISSGTLRGSMDGSGHIWLRSERDSTQAGDVICVTNSGPESSLLEVIGDCIEKVKSVRNPASPKHTNSIEHNSENPGWSLHDSKKAIYCTWNSLGGDYTLSKVLDRLQALQDTGALDKFESVLLDDGWQDSVTGRVLNSFGAKSGWMDVGVGDGIEQYSEEQLAHRDFRRKDSGFQGSRNPSGESIETSAHPLKTAISIIKTRFPQIKSVGVWLTTQGYWDGLKVDGELSKHYNLQKFHRPSLANHYPASHDEKDVYLPALSELDAFWNGYFSVLKAAGVTYVKVDNQADADSLEGEDAGEMRHALGQTMRRVAGKLFGPDNLINCMAGGPREDNEFLSERADARSSMRTSDDFFPEYPETHRFHIANNATTAYLDRFLSVTRDFDMFITHHERADYHALLRTFSNAPIYITDTDQPNMDVLSSLGGKDRQGEYRIVKATNGKSVRLANTVFETVTGGGEGAALKMALPVDEVGGALIGVWNCRADHAMTADALTTRDVSDALGTMVEGTSVAEWAVLERGKESRRCTTLATLDLQKERSLCPPSSQPIFPIRLEGETCTVFTIAPMFGFETCSFAPLGLVDKYVGLCAIRSVKEGSFTKPVKKETRQEQDTVTPVTEKEFEAPQAPVEETVTVAEEETIRNTAFPSETTPLLPRAPVTSIRATSNVRSRLYTLLLFWRSDLQSLRRSLFRDFAVSPFVTLYREIRAAFGGPSTVPDSETSSPQPMMAERGAQAENTIPQSPSESAAPMLENVGQLPAAEAVAPPVQQPEETPVMTEEEEETMEEVGRGVIIETTVAGKLGLLLLAGEASEFTFTLEGQTLDSHVATEGNRVVIDMETAVAELDLGASDATGFTVGILRKA